jgi:selenocysteine lyase/cysteine desulfurase
MQNRLSDIPGVTVYGKNTGGILLFSVRGMTSENVAAYLDAQGICVRAGLHCSPLAHKKFGTPENDGAVRISLGAFNTEEDALALCRCVEDVSRQKGSRKIP